MVSKEDIRQLLSPFISREDAFSKIDQCGRLSNMAAMELQENGIDAERIDGSVTKDGTSLDHSFVLVPASEISGVKDGPVIVDPTAEQFGSETTLPIDFGSIESIESIAIYEPSHHLYNTYQM